MAEVLLSRGFHGPLWVTETGYPADPAWQSDHGFHDGPASQAAWMMRVVPAMLAAGATMVFVTERDSLAGRYASEGILRSSDPLTADPPTFAVPRSMRSRRSPDHGPGTGADQPKPVSPVSCADRSGGRGRRARIAATRPC